MEHNGPPPAWTVPPPHHARPPYVGGSNGWPAESSSSAVHGHSPSSETIGPGSHVQPLPVQPSAPSGYMALHTDPPTIPNQYTQSASRLPSPPAEDDLGADGDLELFYYRFVRSVRSVPLISSHVASSQVRKVRRLLRESPRFPT